MLLPRAETHSVSNCESLPDRHLDETALAVLDSMASQAQFEPDLLSLTTTSDLARAVERLVETLQLIEPQALLKKRGIWHRWTGADVEARLRFEIAAARVGTMIEETRIIADEAKRTVKAVDEAAKMLAADQAKLTVAIDFGKSLLANGKTSEAFLRSRFERRLASLIAIHASNTLTKQQLALARDTLAGLIDRFTDVDTLLVPLWQRMALTVAHTQSDPSDERSAIEAFVARHVHLLTALQGTTR